MLLVRNNEELQTLSSLSPKRGITLRMLGGDPVHVMFVRNFAMSQTPPGAGAFVCGAVNGDLLPHKSCSMTKHRLLIRTRFAIAIHWPLKSPQETPTSLAPKAWVRNLLPLGRTGCECALRSTSGLPWTFLNRNWLMFDRWTCHRTDLAVGRSANGQRPRITLNRPCGTSMACLCVPTAERRCNETPKNKLTTHRHEQKCLEPKWLRELSRDHQLQLAFALMISWCQEKLRVILAYMCVKPQMRLYVCQRVGPFWVHFGSILLPLCEWSMHAWKFEGFNQHSNKNRYLDNQSVFTQESIFKTRISVFRQEAVFGQESTTRQESMFRQECSLDKNSSLDC